MIETIGPAVCGTRRRTLTALALFGLAAVLAAAALGASTGLAGSALPLRALAPLAVVLALLGAAREAGLVRVAVPQRRWQVPERWHHELPLPLWSTGYGAGLGVGVLTYQPVATFWVLLVAVAATASPAVGAVALGAYGVGRLAMAALPERAIDGLASLLPPVRLVNAVALAAVAVALAPAAADAAVPASRVDPSIAADGTYAYAERAADGTSAVVVRAAAGAAEARFAGAASPALDGALLAYADAAGVRVVRWRSGAEVVRLPGALSRPALAWPYLVAVRTLPSGARQLLSFDLATGARRLLDGVRAGDDLGRPALSGLLAVWHRTTSAAAAIRTVELPSGRVRTVVRSAIRLLTNPSLAGHRLVYVSQFHGVSRLQQRWLGRGPVRTLFRTRDPRLIWTTATNGRVAVATSWDTDTGDARLVFVRLRR